LFEFVYDFFVVLARSRVVFTVQVVWLIALVPALIAGAKLDGIGGAALAEVAVAAVLVVPWYLTELNRFAIRRRSLAATLWLPVLASVAIGFAAAAIVRVIPNALAACVVAGLATLAVIAALCYRMRAGLALLKPAFATGDGAIEARDTESAPAAGAISDDRLTPPAPAIVASVPADAAAQAAGLQALLALASPGFHDLTGPLPMYRGARGPRPRYREVASAGEAADPSSPGRHWRAGDEGPDPVPPPTRTARTS